LVTGGAGFIGSRLTGRPIEDGHGVAADLVRCLAAAATGAA
jgi:nucleoside-diphosphate-sugar epimerase